MRQQQLISTKPILLGLALCGVAHADFVFSGDFTKGEGQAVLANSLDFNITETGFLSIFAFDDLVTFDGNFTQQPNAATFSLLLNSNPVTNGALSFVDNFNNTVGDLDSNDGYFQLAFVDEFEVVPGDVVTLEAGTWSNLGEPNFNAEYNSVGAHTGKILLTTIGGLTLAEHQCEAIPEPASGALLGLGLLVFARRKRR